MAEVKIKEFESLMDWFESVYRGKPIEIDWRTEKGDYRATLIFYIKDVKEQRSQKKSN